MFSCYSPWFPRTFTLLLFYFYPRASDLKRCERARNSAKNQRYFVASDNCLDIQRVFLLPSSISALVQNFYTIIGWSPREADLYFLGLRVTLQDPKAQTVLAFTFFISMQLFFSHSQNIFLSIISFWFFVLILFDESEARIHILFISRMDDEPPKILRHPKRVLIFFLLGIVPLFSFFVIYPVSWSHSFQYIHLNRSSGWLAVYFVKKS